MSKLLLIILPILISFSSCTTHVKQEPETDKTSIANIIKPKLLWDSTNTLEDKKQTMKITYVAWGCFCPNWIKPSDQKKNDTNLMDYCMYLEAASEKLWNPNNDTTFNVVNENLIVTGSFYKKTGYPKGTYEGMEDMPTIGKIFQYSKATPVNK